MNKSILLSILIFTLSLCINANANPNFDNSNATGDGIAADSSPSSKLSVLYIVHNFTNSITAYSINPATGMLTPLNINVPTGLYPGDITSISGGKLANKYLYVANYKSPTISEYSIESGYMPLPLNPPEVTTGINGWNTNIDPSGRYAYTGNTYSNTISLFDIDQSTGVLSPNIYESTVSSQYGPAVMGFNGPWVYVVEYYGNMIDIYSFESDTGTITNTNTYVPTGVTPRIITFDNANHY